MKHNSEKKTFRPDKILSYFRAEWKVLLIVTFSGLLYNVGLLAGPWFEGRMTGYLVDVLKGFGTFHGMLILLSCYMSTIAFVQVCRYVKRFYVRRFANNVSKRMKQTLYDSLIQKSRTALQQEGVGSIMTKAIADVDDCVEGMRKLTTEIFDTGVALLAYLAMLLWYDWRLALICMLFPPITYMAAEKLKHRIQLAGFAYKKQAANLSTATLDRAENAVTYRVFGLEGKRQAAYEQNLSAYEKSAVSANIWNAVMPPIYRVLSMAGVLFILFFGQRNVLGIGWQPWSIASFTTFLSCFVKLSVKSSSAAKLFNAIHKAQVSWERIRPLLPQAQQETPSSSASPWLRSVNEVVVRHLCFAYPDGRKILDNISFTAKKGQIIGIAGPVACGKSTLGKMFLCEYPYEGQISVDGAEFSRIDPKIRAGIVSYLGHDPELFDESVENNILMGSSGNTNALLRAVCMEKEVAQMHDGPHTRIGNGGVRLSGGQGKRLALARTLCHSRPIVILDDPFSALDRETERRIFSNLKDYFQDKIVLLISHRLYLFPQLDQILWMENGNVTSGTHEELLQTVPQYRQQFFSQTCLTESGGAEDEQ